MTFQRPRSHEDMHIPLPDLSSLNPQNLISIQSTVHNVHLHNALVAMVNGLQQLAAHVNQTKSKISHIALHVEKQDNLAAVVNKKLDEFESLLKTAITDSEHNARCIKWCKTETQSIIDKQKRLTTSLMSRLADLGAVVERIDNSVTSTREALEPIVDKADTALRTTDEHRQAIRWAVEEVSRLRDRCNRDYTDLDEKLTVLSRTVLHQADGVREARQSLSQAVDDIGSKSATAKADMDALLHRIANDRKDAMNRVRALIRQLDETAHAAGDEVTQVHSAQDSLRNQVRQLGEAVEDMQREVHSEANDVMAAVSDRCNASISELNRAIAEADKRRTLLAAQMKAVGQILVQQSGNDDAGSFSAQSFH